jgi:hypothetical protein
MGGLLAREHCQAGKSSGRSASEKMCGQSAATQKY